MAVVEPNWDKPIRYLALVAFALYVRHNFLYLWRGQVPPSMLIDWYALPCPTTGCIRSLRSFSQGAVAEGFLWNPFSVLFCCLCAISVFVLLVAVGRKQKVLLPNWLGVSWLVILPLAWVVKLVQGPAWW